VRAEFKLEQNEEFACRVWEPRPRTSYSAHNPTLAPNVESATLGVSVGLCAE